MEWKKFGISVSFLIILLSIALWAIIEQSLFILYFLTITSYVHALVALEMINNPAPHGSHRKDTLKYLTLTSAINCVALALTAVTIAWPYIKQVSIDQSWGSNQFFGFCVLCAWVILAVILLASIVAAPFLSNTKKNLASSGPDLQNTGKQKIVSTNNTMKTGNLCFEIENAVSDRYQNQNQKR